MPTEPRAGCWTGLLKTREDTMNGECSKGSPARHRHLPCSAKSKGGKCWRRDGGGAWPEPGRRWGKKVLGTLVRIASCGAYLRNCFQPQVLGHLPVIKERPTPAAPRSISRTWLASAQIASPFREYCSGQFCHATDPCIWAHSKNDNSNLHALNCFPAFHTLGVVKH
jgi:hypothetical protein